jgi:uncharacterized protein YpuA (DUF1002 family)
VTILLTVTLAVPVVVLVTSSVTNALEVSLVDVALITEVVVVGVATSEHADERMFEGNCVGKAGTDAAPVGAVRRARSLTKIVTRITVVVSNVLA